MKVFIQTRGFLKDYQFLGDEPRKWWRAPHYENGTSFEKPTFIFEVDVKVWRCYISGIPSSRMDRVATPIRYTVVLEGDKSAEDKKSASSFLKAFISTSAKNGDDEFKSIFDRHFDFDIDACISNKEYQPISDCIPSLLDAINNLACRAGGENCPLMKNMCAAINALDREAFAFLNLVNGQAYIDSDIRSAFDKSTLSRLTVLKSLQTGEAFSVLEKPQPQQEPAKTNPPAREPKAGSESRPPAKKKGWIIILMVLMVATVILALLKS